jgi:hypothetical protein
MLGSSWVAAQLAAAQEGIRGMSEWVPFHKEITQIECICEQIIRENLQQSQERFNK